MQVFGIPQSNYTRTVRMVSNVEVFHGSEDRVMVRSNFLTTDWRAGETRFWSGWCGHRQRRREARLEIEVRQVNLVDCDQNLRNPSLIL